MTIIKFRIIAGLLSITSLIINSSNILCAQSTVHEVQSYIDERVSRDVNQGIVVGIITFSGTQFFQAGTYSQEDQRPITPDTLFEIGSASQLFTASATAVLVKEKQFSWQSPVNPLLPKDADPPNWQGKSMRIFDLATHSAALPRLPLNLDPKANRANPYAHFTQQDLYRNISQAQFPYALGQKYEYSQYGYAILGHALELRTAKTYETILRETLTTPLNLKSTTTEPNPQQLKNLARGHLGLAPAENWDYNAMIGDGGIYTSAKDMLQFLGAHLGLFKNSLTPILKPLQARYLTTHLEHTHIGYAWHITQKDADPIHWISGITGGYSAFIGMNILQRKGVVVLSNTSESIDEIGFNLLAPNKYPLGRLPKLYPIPAKLLENYTGNYKITPQVSLTVTRKGGRLYVQFTGEPKFRVYPVSEKTFEYAHGKRILKFDIKRKGKARSVSVIENFKSLTAKRIR